MYVSFMRRKKTQKTRHTSFITFTSDFFGSLGTIFDRSIGLKKSIWRPKMSPSKFGECETGSSVVLNIGFTLATGFPFESLRIFAASDRLMGPLLLVELKKHIIFYRELLIRKLTLQIWLSHHEIPQVCS